MRQGKTKIHPYLSAPSTSLKEGISPSAPCGTRPRTDSAKDLATSCSSRNSSWTRCPASTVSSIPASKCSRSEIYDRRNPATRSSCRSSLHLTFMCCHSSCWTPAKVAWRSAYQPSSTPRTTTHNMECRLRTHAAAVFPLTDSGTQRPLAATKPRQNRAKTFLPQRRSALPLRQQPPRVEHACHRRPAPDTCTPSF